MGTDKMRLLLQIFATFLKFGPVTFGGGFAMVPLIEREVADKRKWVGTRDIADMITMAQSVPGAVAVNSAIFVGYRVAGFWGAAAAMIGILLPTFCIVLLLSLLYWKLRDNPVVEAAFVSIRVTIVALISYAAYKIGKIAVVDKTTVAIIFATVALLLFVHLHPIALIAGGALASVAIVRIRKALGLRTKLGEEPSDADKYKDPGYFMGDGI